MNLFKKIFFEFEDNVVVNDKCLNSIDCVCFADVLLI